MNYQFILLAFYFITAQIAFCSKYPIKYVVVLMMENRSFDHMLGWMTEGGKYGNPKVDGLKGNECNYKFPRFPWQGKICVSKGAPDSSDYDPVHGYVGTTERIYSCHFEEKNNPHPNITNPCVNHSSLKGKASMGGFLMSARQQKRDGLTEMSAQNLEDVPILATLANEFTLFDRYFSSYPGATNPNRLFVHSGTSSGSVGNEQVNGEKKNTTLQEVLSKHNLTWKHYHDGDPEDWFLFLDYFNNIYPNSTLFPPTEQFYKDCEKGDLPNYTFINPAENVNPKLMSTKSYGLMNDQHPNHSIREGERLIKNVYEALRNSPLWNETLLILNYDEHGGFYDHVPPPQEGIPSPDDVKNIFGFNFDRLGLRVPMILISPWIEKGTLINQPAPHQKPFSNSEFEHTSIISSVLKIFGIKHYFSKRVEWAATFDDLLLTRKEPRTDCPLKLQNITAPTMNDIGFFYSRPLKDRQINRVKVICYKIKPHDLTCGNNVLTQRDFHYFIENIKKELESNSP